MITTHLILDSCLTEVKLDCQTVLECRNTVVAEAKLLEVGHALRAEIRP